MAWRFRGDRDWGGVAPLTLGAGLVAVAIVADLFLVAGDIAGGAHYGLAQRLALAAGGFWIAALAAGLLAIHAPPGRRARPAAQLASWLASSSSSRS
jgi:hypothetical protein